MVTFASAGTVIVLVLKAMSFAVIPIVTVLFMLALAPVMFPAAFPAAYTGKERIASKVRERRIPINSLFPVLKLNTPKKLFLKRI